MGNIITQANDDARAYSVDTTGNLSLLNTLNAKTGVFDNTSWFKQNIMVDGTVDGVDLSVLKTTVDGMAGAGQGTFTGKSVAALNFTGTSGNFDNLTVSATGTFGTIKTSLLDINGNITNTTGPKYITASTGSGIKLENGSTTTNGFVQVNSNGSISIMPYTGTSLVLGGNMTGAGSINMSTGTFNGLKASSATMDYAYINGPLYVSGTYNAPYGTLPGTNIAGQITTSESSNDLALGTTNDGGSLLLNRNTILSSSRTLTLSGNMTGAGNINAGAGTFSSLTLSGALTGTTGTFNGLLIARTGANIMGSFTGATGTFTNLLNASGGLTTTNLTGTSIATIGGMLNANGGITLPSGSTMTFGGNMTGAGNINAGTGTFSSVTTTGAISGGAGTFSSALTVNGGLTLPSSATLTLSGNMTGAGNINAGKLIQINQSTVPTYVSATSAMTNNNGLLIQGATNKWSIGEVKGPRTTSGNRLCFSLGDIPFACIDPTTKNLVGANDSTW